MRELILETLRKEKHISGEEIGKRLNISRTAVWKHINELRDLGYQIESSPKSGYSFINSTNLLLADEVVSVSKRESWESTFYTMMPYVRLRILPQKWREAEPLKGHW